MKLPREMNAKNAPKIRVAVLDKNGRLTGVAMKASLAKGDIEAGDLPADGTYRWIGKSFVPLGHGHGKPRRPGVDRDYALYLLMRALINGTPIPQECADWCAWYENNGLAERAK